MLNCARNLYLASSTLCTSIAWSLLCRSSSALTKRKSRKEEKKIREKLHLLQMLEPEKDEPFVSRSRININITCNIKCFPGKTTIWNVGFVGGETLWNSQSKDEKQQPIQARCVASSRIEPRLRRWFHAKVSVPVPGSAGAEWAWGLVEATSHSP